MHFRSFWRGLMDLERSRMSILTGWQQFKISSTYFQPSLTALAPSSDLLAIPVKKGENLCGTTLEGECHFKGELVIKVFSVYVFKFYFMVLCFMGLILYG